MFRGSEMEAGVHQEHLRKIEQQEREAAKRIPKAKGRCDHCGHEWDIEEDDPRQLTLGLPEGSQG